MKHFNNILNRLTSPRAIFVMFIVAAIVPNVILSFTEPLTTAGRIVNIMLPLGIYSLLLGWSPNIGRTVWILFPILFLAAFQLVLLSLYGRSVIAVDMFLNLTTTNPGEAGELLGSMWPTLIVVAVLYLPPLVLAVRLWRGGNTLRPEFIRRSRVGGGVATEIGLVALLVCFSSDRAYSMHNDLYPVNVGYNIGLAVDHSMKLSKYGDTSRDFTFNARSVHPDSLSETYVLVIGETSRADHWELCGYNRHTNPMLKGVYGKEIHFFPRAMSESNTTHKSVPLMMSHLTPRNYGDSIYQVKSIISAFKEAGFETAFISCQRHNGSFIDFFGEEADSCIFIREPDGLNMADADDMDLIRVLDGMLRKPARKRLVVLHCYGSHFNYYDRYPREYARFKPDTYSEASLENRDRLINAYDNTIAMTDRVLDHVILSLKRCDGVSAMIYTSDHGEDIFDDSRNLFLHASPCPSFYQLLVPFLVWVSEDYNRHFPAVRHQLERTGRMKVSSNSSFFNTAIDIAGVTTPHADLTYSVASPRFREHERDYLNDHNRSVSLRNCGFTAADMAQLRELDGD